MANCTYCNKPIVLVPSAAERARKFGGKPSDYTSLFTAHSECQIKAREESTRELMAGYRNGEITHARPTYPSQGGLCCNPVAPSMRNEHGLNAIDRGD